MRGGRDQSAGDRRARRSKGAASTDAEVAGPRLVRRQGSSLNHQIFLVMRDRILNGYYEAGQMLPSEDELARLFSVSRITLRSAMTTLEAEHLIERRQGVGTFVAPTIRPTQLHASVTGVIEHIADIDRKTEVRLLELDYVRAPFHVQSMFDCDDSAVFQRAVRLRSMGQVPIFHIITFIPQELGKEFTREELNSTSLYKLLARSGVRLHSGQQVVSAQLADPVVAPLLNVAVGSPLLQLRRQHFDQSGRLIEYFEMLASPTMFELSMSLDPEQLSN
ncbi:GntR family transcriptional regulator [Sphingomonas sp. Root1294]|nr:GntR family transcriptional regulator [Sphingomonas sp. Root1294]